MKPVTKDIWDLAVVSADRLTDDPKMYKMIDDLVKQYHDKSCELARFANSNELPDFIRKSTSAEAACLMAFACLLEKQDKQTKKILAIIISSAWTANLKLEDSTVH